MPTNSDTNRIVHIICNTHWDREWRFSFQQSRMMLVRMMDGLLELMESNPKFSYYHLDSHVIMLDDYLEIRPEKRPQVEKLVSEGRLLIGPWYTLPDATMTDGEGLIRNLLVGDRTARAYGKVMKVGYTPNGFGQVSQTPQIYQGFGLDTVMFYRGINRQVAPRSEFIWEAPDGSRVLGFRFGQFSRYNFHYLTYRPVLKNRFFREGGKYRWEDGGVPFHPADIANDAYYKEYWLLEAGEPINYDNLGRALDDLLEETGESTTRHLLGMAGDDQMGPNPLLPDLADRLTALHDDVDVQFSNLPDYMEAYRAAMPDDLKVVRGEMRHSSMNGLMTDLYWGILAARSYMKVEAFQQEMNYFRWAEPFSAIAWVLGKEYPRGSLELALKLLLENQAHDSIGGCALDKIHQDVMHRFSEVKEITNVLTREAAAHVVQQIDAGTPDDILVAVFNPMPAERSEVVSVALEVHRDKGAVRVSVSDLDGKSMGVQDSFRQQGDLMVQQPTDVPIPFFTDRFLVHFTAEKVPAFGYKTFKVTPETVKKHPWGSMLVAPNAMANEHLSVTVDCDGTLTVTDKATGATYSGLLLFEDSGDTGDPWVRRTPLDNPVILSAGQPVRVAVKEAGPLLTSFIITRDLQVPESASQDLKSRSQTLTPLRIESTITLRKGAHRLDVVTKVNNTAKDHRLRVLFPTRLQATTSQAGSVLDVLTRLITLPDTSGWVEPMPHTHPHRHFVDVTDGAKGFALATEGLVEYEVSDDPSRTLALTLIRAFQQRNSVRGIEYPEQKDSQCLREHEFRFAILPHEGDYVEGAVVQEAFSHNLPLRSYQFGCSGKGTLSAAGSFLNLAPSVLALSGVKRGEDGQSLVVRFYNPTDETLTGTLSTLFPIAEACLTNMLEEPLESLAVKNNAVTLSVGPKKVVTVGLKVRSL